MGVPRPRRSFDHEFKLQVVRQGISGEKQLALLCREHQLAESMVRRWREQYEQQGENAWPEAADLVSRPVYSLTLVRTFRSRSGGYLSTTKLSAEDAPLAAEAFRQAAEWLRQGAEAEEPLPF